MTLTPGFAVSPNGEVRQQMVDLGVVVRRARAAVAARLAHERAALPAVAETTVAAGAAWLLARILLPEPHPVFAPLTAIIALGTTRGQRGTRAVQVSLGVALGLGAADVIVRLLGVGTWQLMLVTALALLGAGVVSASDTLIIQAGVSGALVVAVGSLGAEVPYRFFEALVGAGIALLTSQVLSPFDARRGLAEAVSRILRELGAALDTTADGLDGGTDDWADRAERRLRTARMRLVAAEELLARGRRAAEVSRRRSARRTFKRYAAATGHLDLAVSDGRALVAAARRAEAAGGLSPRLVRCLGETAELARRVGADPAGSGNAVRAEASRVSDTVTAVLTAERRAAVQAVGDLLLDVIEVLGDIVCDDRPPAPPRRRAVRGRRQGDTAAQRSIRNRAIETLGGR